MLWDFLESNIDRHKKSCVMDFQSGRQITYEHLICKVNELYEKFLSLLVSKTKCAILCKNKTNECTIILSCLKAKVIPIIMSENYGKEHCIKIIERTQPDIAVVDSAEYRNLFEIPVYNIIDQKQPSIKYSSEKSYLQDVALIMCTSGTTGSPKGVMISEQGLISNIQAIQKYFDIKEREKILISRPFYHCAVLTGELLVSLVNGLDLIFCNGKYDPFLIKRVIDNLHIEVMCGTPTIFNQLSKLYRGTETNSTIHKMALSGECLSKEIAINIRKAFPNAEIYNIYGLTENSPRVSFLPPSKFDEFPESVGIGLVDTIIRIVDDDGNDVENGKSGHIVVKSKSIMLGYYKEPQETNDKIRDGYLWTGDMGYKDSNNNLYILGRADDMIIKAGLNIYPREIESILLRCTYIENCIAYGVKRNGTEQIQVEIVLKQAVRESDLWEILSEILPEHLIPDKIVIVDALKRNASGKLVRGAKFQGGNEEPCGN
ncbi:MAG: acyl--CoA ligase [Lachnoclostridium sp.]|nr:acyl--CoA ligase [Lachnospira sp.]MCM1248923.1 acyl--CoA ligase [Lachnoclostridium sp.]